MKFGTRTETMTSCQRSTSALNGSSTVRLKMFKTIGLMLIYFRIELHNSLFNQT